MTLCPPISPASLFQKHYPSEAAAEAALGRSLAARRAGVPTPAVLGRSGPRSLAFARIEAVGTPTRVGMVSALQALRAMPPDGLDRFDPFLRIRPRLGGAPACIRALVTTLEARDAALGWPAATVIHGDFHPGQVMRDGSGKLWLLDLDDLALAPPEADLGNLSAWIATQTEGDLPRQAKAALAEVLALSAGADLDLAAHFQTIALVRRALKLAGKAQPWALDQLGLRA